MPRLVARPVTPARWDDFARLFEAKGSPHFCWCTPYRIADAHKMDKKGRRAAMQRLVRKGAPIGLLAYEGQEPVGWCSVAPRDAHAKLARSKTMPTVDEDAWTVLCFFVPRARRGEGIALALLKAAVKHARAEGASAIEGYPYDTSGVSSTHRGHSSLFERAGFKPDEGRRWVRRFRR